ncbi:MAG: DUF664 domain-containing protein [Actinobacteria bacterium]|nr:DUF664 domain-containing protein [Actinomycetota bacterium]
MIRHLAGVDRWWFNFAGSDAPLLYYSDQDPNQDFDDLEADPLDDLALWRAGSDRSREIVAATPSLDAIGATRRDGQQWTLRWLLLRVITEYPQHDGHADLLREATDGATGA